MPPRIRRKGKKPETKVDATPEVGDEQYQSAHGFVIIGNEAEVTTQVSAKVSKNYQSVEVVKGLKFRTPADQVAKSLEKSTEFLHESVKAEVNTRIRDLVIEASDMEP